MGLQDTTWTTKFTTPNRAAGSSRSTKDASLVLYNEQDSFGGNKLLRYILRDA